MRKQTRFGFKAHRRRHSSANNPYSKVWLPVRTPSVHITPYLVTRRGPGTEAEAQTGEERPPGSSSAGKLLVSVIIPAMNEQKTIGAVVREARHVHPHTEVIVVENGSSDRTYQGGKSGGRASAFLSATLGA